MSILSVDSLVAAGVGAVVVVSSQVAYNYVAKAIAAVKAKVIASVAAAATAAKADAVKVEAAVAKVV